MSALTRTFHTVTIRRPLLFAVMLAAGGSLARADSTIPTRISVSHANGVYLVAATFEVAAPAAKALAVLTDYEQIPRFMPDVRSSVVRQRSTGRALVEQEAVSRFMMFSKRVHLLLDIVEGADDITFEDRCGTSFKRYLGRWIASVSDGRTLLTYELRAEPAFEVP